MMQKKHLRIDRFVKQFNWRFLLIRVLINALALAVTAAILPKIYFVDKSIGNWLLMAFMLGLLNALLKPVLQFLTLQFIFVTYGLVIVLVNSLLLWLLSLLFPNRFAVDSLLWLLVGGLVLGLVSSFLESLLGLTMPIVPDELEAVRRQIEEQARQTDWLTPATSEAMPEESALATERPLPRFDVAEPVSTEAAAPETAVAETDGPEWSAPGPEEGPSPRMEVGAEPLDPGVPASTEPAPEPLEEHEEDRS